MTIICSVSARHIVQTATDDSLFDECVDVVVMIKKVSDTDNLFQYRSNRGEHVILGATDLDDVDIESSTTSIQANFGDYGGCNHQIFTIEDSVEYSLFREAVLECRMLSEMTLRLGSFVRDIYFAGIYSAQEGGGHSFLYSDMIQMLRDQQLMPTEFSLFNITNEKVTNEDTTECQTTADDIANVIDKRNHHKVTDMNCVFCGVQKMMEITKEFATHPYVPATFENKNIYMCLPCLQNWKEFREKAIFDKQLILKDEVNEELCGICSDTPAELIMCSECPRSFCNGCLMRILNEKEIKELDSLTDWVCMCCRLYISSESPELNKSKWNIVKPTLGKRLNSGNSFFSKANTARLKKSIEVDNDNNSATKICKNRDLQNIICESEISTTSVQKPDIVASCSPEKLFGKSSLSSASKKTKEISDLKQTDKKGNNSCPVIAAPSSPDELPYLDDFDDGSSSEDEKVKIWDHNDDNDDDCNLLISLPQQGFSSSENFSEEIETTSKKKRPLPKKVKQQTLSPPPKIQNVKSVKKNAKRKSSVGSSSSPPADILPPVNTVVDEVYYFSQYVQYYDGMCQEANKTVVKKASATDDVCFLCKDGGDLIECDHQKAKHFDSRRRCRKVYHSYCLAYVVEDDDRDWRCPRHFCDFCGTTNLKYLCKFCPMSICGGCPTAMVKKYGLARYKIVDTPSTGEFATKVITIVCQNCLDMYQRCLARGLEYNNFSEYTLQTVADSPELRFSNVPSIAPEKKNKEMLESTEEDQSVKSQAKSVKKEKILQPSTKMSSINDPIIESSTRSKNLPVSTANRWDKILNLRCPDSKADSKCSIEPETKNRRRKRNSEKEDCIQPDQQDAAHREESNSSQAITDTTDVKDVVKRIGRRPRNRSTDSASDSSPSDIKRKLIESVDIQCAAEVSLDGASDVTDKTVAPCDTYALLDTGNNSIRTHANNEELNPENSTPPQSPI